MSFTSEHDMIQCSNESLFFPMYKNIPRPPKKNLESAYIYLTLLFKDAEKGVN